LINPGVKTMSALKSAAFAPVLPGAWLGVLGGGQLGRMFCHAAQALGYQVAVLDPDPASPAGRVADLHLCADYLDADALAELSDMCDAVTTEFENVPASALAQLAERCVVAPSAASVSVAQDRLVEKRFIESCGIPVAPHAAVLSEADCQAIAPNLLPGILKVARLGYDGKGQARVAHAGEALDAFRAFGGVPCVLEKMLELELEISVVCVRNAGGDVVAYDAVENEHRDGILAVTLVPAVNVSPSLAASAREHAAHIASQLNYVGVLCVEFFVLADGHLVVNEMAPRPHNSGHATIDACVMSQFEQQVRAMTGLPLGTTRQHSPAVMLNLLGDLWFAASGAQREPAWPEVLALTGTHLHLYGKVEPRRGRKMGHLTCTAETLAQAQATARAAAALLGLRF
jgi:5-(carboxyamino)imidazole ribonucleotide synthase